jgi:DNA replication protein DnaC
MKTLGDLLKKNLGLYDITPEPVNEAVQSYFQKIYAEKIETQKPTADQIKEKLIKLANYKLESRGSKFVMDATNEGFIKLICLYLADDKRVINFLSGSNHKVINQFSFSKGLLLAGSYGVGKSMILQLVSQMSIPDKSFGFKTTNTTVQQYEAEGPKFIKQFFTGNRCFDDFGTENKAWHYGKQVDIFKTILEERYNTFIDKGLTTHLSTNLTLDEIAKRYGERVESRLYEMFNIVVITGKDRRK